jgi:uncharacterized membrane protein
MYVFFVIIVRALHLLLWKRKLSDLISRLKRNNIYRLRRRRGASMRTRYIFQKPMDILMVLCKFCFRTVQSFIEFYTQLSLFIADLLQAIGAAMDLKWVGSGHLEVGQFCSAQGDFLPASSPV